MKYLLDTNICIFLFAPGHLALKDRFLACDEGDVGVSAITFAELSIGSWNGKPPPIWLLDGFQRQVPPLAFDVLAARHYAQLPFKRGSFDRLIAAHALALKLTLVTDNQADFADIAGLEVENWMAT